MTIRSLALLTLLLLFVPARADEGMWLFNRPPLELLKKKYGLKLDSAWLENAQKASVRFNNGGSGGFVSPDGLVVTNHHIGADSILKLSAKGKDLHRDGFYAAERTDELKCPDLELNVLQEIVDVTADIKDAVKPEMTPAQSQAARSAIFAKIAERAACASAGVIPALTASLTSAVTSMICCKTFNSRSGHFSSSVRSAA